MPRVDLIFRHAPGTPHNAAARVADLNTAFAPTNFSFAAAGASVQEGLASVNVGMCATTSGPTAAVTALFNAVILGASQAVVFLANQVLAAATGTTGCARHPTGKPGVVVGRNGGRWVLAHEIGHMLGLPHRDSGLMRDNPSQLPATQVPQLTAADIAALAGPIALNVMGPAVRRAPRVPAVPHVTPVRAPRPAARVHKLVARSLSRIKNPRTPNVIDRVAASIECRPALLREYRSLRRSLGTAALHRAIGQETRRQTGMVSSGRTARGTSLFTRVAVLRRRRRG